MDLTKPIDIQAVNNTAVKYSNVLKALNMLKVEDVLKLFTPMIGVQSSVVLGKTEHGSISKKYTGTFVGDKQLGKVVPRTLTVNPCVAEMADEPERYRRTFIADVAGGLWDKKHPFELWLLQYGINIASEDLYNCVLTAKIDAGSEALSASFDGLYTIIDADITAGKITEALGNKYATGDITRANCGEVLLNMWRNTHKTLRSKQSNMIISEDVGDLYDDWYNDEHDNPPGIDKAGQMFLLGTNKRVKLVRTAAAPSGCKRVVLSTRENLKYGTDKLADMKAMKAFNSGNPYLFTAAMKYVFGVQILSIHKREFVVNDQPGSGSGSASS